MCGALGRGFGIPIDGISLTLGEIGIDVSVGAEFFMNATAEKFIDRFAHRFADDIPQGNFNSGKNTHQAYIGAQRVAGAIDLAPQAFDVKRIHAQDVASESILNHGRSWPLGRRWRNSIHQCQ